MRRLLLSFAFLLMICLPNFVGQAQVSAITLENLQPITAVNAGSIQNIATFEVPNVYIAFPDPTGRMILAETLTGVGSEQKLGYVLWDVEAGMPSATIDSGSYSGGTFSPDGKLLALDNYNDKTVELRDAKTAKIIQTIKSYLRQDFATFSPDSTTLA